MFYDNIRTLPLDEFSTFIRSEGGGNSFVNPPQPGGTHFTSYLGSMKELIQAFDAGRVTSHAQVLATSRKP